MKLLANIVYYGLRALFFGFIALGIMACNVGMFMENPDGTIAVWLFFIVLFVCWAAYEWAADRREE